MKTFELRAHFASIYAERSEYLIPQMKHCPWCGSQLSCLPDISPDTKKVWMWRYRCTPCYSEIQVLARESEEKGYASN